MLKYRDLHESQVYNYIILQHKCILSALLQHTQYTTIKFIFIYGKRNLLVYRRKINDLQNPHMKLFVYRLTKSFALNG